MSGSTISNFVLYNDQFYSGYVERLMDNIDVFNQLSNNTITLNTDLHEGDFQKKAFIQYSDSGVFHRTPGSISAQADTGPTADDETAPKVNKGVHEAYTQDLLRKIGKTDEEIAYAIGLQYADKIGKAMVESALSCLTGGFAVAGLSSALVHTDTTGGLTFNKLVKGLRKMGDKASNIRAWVMHSKSYFDLVENQVNDNILEVSGAIMYGASPATLNRPVVVIDNPILWAAGSSTASSADDVYNIFGLQPGAIQVTQSESQAIYNQLVTGTHNVQQRIVYEMAYTLRMLGMDFTGSANPADSALATSSNWAKTAHDVKGCPGILIKSR